MEHSDETEHDRRVPSVYRHISVVNRDGVLVVRFIDLKRDLGYGGSAQEIGQELEGLVNPNHPCSLILDFERKELDPLQAAFYGTLVRLLKLVKQAQGTIKLCNLPSGVLEQLKINQLIRVFPIYKSVDDALAGDVPDSAMHPRREKSGILPGIGKESSAPRLRIIVRKSALLNLAIVLTSFPVLVLVGGPKAVVPALAIMAGISVLIWTLTFTLFSFVSLPWIFRTPVSSVTRRDPPHPTEEAGFADPRVDEPV